MVVMLDNGYSFRSPRATIWVAVADPDRVRIFRLDETADMLVELKVIRPADDTYLGNTGNGGSRPAPSRGSFPPRASWSTGPADRPAALLRGLDGYLVEARQCGLYDRLILLAPPDLLPLLVAGLSPPARRSLMAEMESDRTPRSAMAIRSILSV